MGMSGQFCTCPVAPQYCGATPTDVTPFLITWVSSAISTPSGPPRCSTTTVADLIAQRVSVPARPVAQPLQPMLRAVPDVIGQLPGVLPRHISQQAPDQVSEAHPWFRTGQQRAGDPLGQRPQVLIPAHDLIVGDVIVHMRSSNQDDLRYQDLRM